LRGAVVDHRQLAGRVGEARRGVHAGQQQVTEVRHRRGLATHRERALRARLARVGDVDEPEPLTGTVGVDDRAAVLGDRGDLRDGRVVDRGIEVRGEGRETLELSVAPVRRSGGRRDVQRGGRGKTESRERRRRGAAF
jgi:hypothetical protein